MYMPMFLITIFVKNCKFRMKCVEKYDGSAFGLTHKCWICKLITATYYEIFPGFSLSLNKIPISDKLKNSLTFC